MLNILIPIVLICIFIYFLNINYNKDIKKSLTNDEIKNKLIDSYKQELEKYTEETELAKKRESEIKKLIDDMLYKYKKLRKCNLGFETQVTLNLYKEYVSICRTYYNINLSYPIELEPNDYRLKKSLQKLIDNKIYSVDGKSLVIAKPGEFVTVVDMDKKVKIKSIDLKLNIYECSDKNWYSENQLKPCEGTDNGTI